MSEKNTTTMDEELNLTAADRAQIRRAINNLVDRIEAHSFALLLRLFDLMALFERTYIKR